MEKKGNFWILVEKRYFLDKFWQFLGILVIPDPQLYTNSPKGISFQSGVID
jgi:hypothetical protein